MHIDHCAEMCRYRDVSVNIIILVSRHFVIKIERGSPNGGIDYLIAHQIVVICVMQKVHFGKYYSKDLAIFVIERGHPQC